MALIPDLDQHQNLIHYSLAQSLSNHQISWKSVDERFEISTQMDAQTTRKVEKH